MVVYLSLQIHSLISRRPYLPHSVFASLLSVSVTLLMQLLQMCQAFSPEPASTTIRGSALPYLDCKDWSLPGLRWLPFPLSSDHLASHSCSLTAFSFFPSLGYLVCRRCPICLHLPPSFLPGFLPIPIPPLISPSLLLFFYLSTCSEILIFPPLNPSTSLNHHIFFPSSSFQNN